MWRNPWGSYKEGAAYLRARGITINMSGCFLVCFTAGTNGFSRGFFSSGKGGGAKALFGASVYATFGTPPSSANVSALGCYVVCGGGYKNFGPGGGAQFGVGTPGFFLGPSLPFPWDWGE
jgi:hypothetical protein